ncbi:MAG TPA: HAMP domain-containing sensor histidine kinase [Chryseosolibacter sp.]
MENEELKRLASLLDERNQLLLDKERDLADRSEELVSQKEELTAAIEEVIEKNAYLNETLKKLQQRNQELDQILYRASHDLKSPVTSIFGLLDLLKGEGLTQSQNIICNHIFQRTTHMMALLNSLNMLAQAAFDSIDIKAVNVHSVVSKAVARTSVHPNFKNATFDVQVPDNLQFNGDELKLGIIITCLVDNALSFCSAQSSKILITAHSKNSVLEIRVADEGEGINPDIKNRIFEMFYRGSERSQGAGLGLYIVKSIVDRLEGTVAVESQAGKTMFTIALPASASRTDAQVP